MWQAHTIKISLSRIKIEAEFRTLFQFFGPIGKDTNTQFRPLQISKDGDGGIQIGFNLTDDLVL